MKNPIKTLIFVTAAGLFCATFVQRTSAATNTIQVGSAGLSPDVFIPSTVSISVNDTVIWNWSSGFHTTTSGTNGVHGDDNGVPTGLWDSSPAAAPPHTFTNTFTSTGTFVYYCAVHASFGMTGEVLVASATVPPSLAITNPSSGATFAEPANVTIQASVTNGSGTVTNVQFFANNTLEASENSGPFSAVANSLAAGDYTLSAIAKDNNGLSATNSVSISVVTPVTIVLTNSSRPSGTDFKFNYSANIGLNYVVQRSGDLMTWLPLATNTAASNPVLFDDSNATNSLDFYRVGRLPNP